MRSSRRPVITAWDVDASASFHSARARSVVTAPRDELLVQDCWYAMRCDPSRAVVESDDCREPLVMGNRTTHGPTRPKDIYLRVTWASRFSKRQKRVMAAAVTFPLESDLQGQAEAPGRCSGLTAEMPIAAMTEACHLPCTTGSLSGSSSSSGISG